jgi:hypothetical protein
MSLEARMDKRTDKDALEVLDADLAYEREVHRVYRRRATIGGGCVGLILGAIFAGPYVQTWTRPAAYYAIAIGITAALGALTGYLFREIIVAQLAIGRDARHRESREHNESADPSQGDAGDD